MAVKLVVIYPRPKDIEAFETVFNEDHVPMAVGKLAGKAKIVATRVLGSPVGRTFLPPRRHTKLRDVAMTLTPTA